MSTNTALEPKPPCDLFHEIDLKAYVYALGDVLKRRINEVGADPKRPWYQRRNGSAVAPPPEASASSNAQSSLFSSRRGRLGVSST